MTRRFIADEGYVLIAANSEHYLELAVNAACSLRKYDNRPTALMISGGLQVPSRYLHLFDCVVAFDPHGLFGGNFTRRFVLDAYTPFRRSMHVDADCLLLSRSVDQAWAQFRGLPVGTVAHTVKEGIFFNNAIDVGALVNAGICDQFALTNWGVFYFEVEEGLENCVMAEARQLLEAEAQGRSLHRYTYLSQPGQYSDEPIWGLALPRAGISALEPDYACLLQATSPNSSAHVFDFEAPRFSMTKGSRSGVSGYFFHFCGLRPLAEYLQGVRYFRRAMDVPMPVITEGTAMIHADDWQAAIRAGGMSPNWRFRPAGVV